jgi:hypothetical protein
MFNQEKLTISSLVWGERPRELILTQGEAIESLGHTHHFFRFDETIPPGTQVVFVQGPYETLVPLIEQLISKPIDERPTLVYWFQQSLCLPRPHWVCELLSRTFSDLHQAYDDLTGLGKLANRLAPSFFTSRGARLGFLGDMLWLSEHGLLDVLALSSTVYASYLRRFDIPSIVVPRGSAPSHGALLNSERDIAAVWMGKLRTKRRRRALYWLKQQLERKGLVMHVYDGGNEGFIFGKRRTEILNRTWFVLNVFFSGPTDELSIRFFIAGANGAVVLTEPGANEYPFKAGEHIVVSKIEDMPAVIEHYLDNKDQWQTISDNMTNLIRDELTLDNSVARILASVDRLPKRPADNSR